MQDKPLATVVYVEPCSPDVPVSVIIDEAERGGDAVLLHQEEDESMAEAKPLLAKLLNQWKHEFRTYYEREPKKSDIMHDDFIRPFYSRYQEIGKVEKLNN